MNETQRLMRNTGLIAVGNLSTKLISFFLLPLYTALLSTADYGNYDYLITIATFCVPFVSVLMDESIFRYLIDCKTADDQKRVMSTSVVIVLIGMGAFAVIGVPVMWLLKYKYTVYAVLYILISTAGGMMSAVLRGIGRTDQFALYNFITGFIQILLNVLFIAVLRWGLVGLLLPALITQPLMILFFFLKLRLWKLFSFRAFGKKLAGEMIRYALPLIPNKLSWTIINLSSRFAIMNVLGESANGLYAVSYKFPNLMDMVYGFFYQSWKESSARILDDDSRDSFYQSVYDNLKNLLMALVVGMTAFMPIAFSFLVDADYYSAIYYVPPLLLATYFSNISGFYGGIFTAYKDTKIMGITTGVAAAINLAATILSIRFLGLYAAALATLLANFVIYIYRKIKVRKYVRLKENVFSTAASVLVTAAVLALFYLEGAVYIAIACAISVVYAVVANRVLIKSLMQKVLHRQ